MNPNTSQSEASLHAVDYWQVIRNRYGIILITTFLVILTAAVVTYVMPEKYESSATIEVKPPGQEIDPLEGVVTRRQFQPTAKFFGTEFEKIKSRNSLSRVVEALDLTERWETDEEIALQKLKNIVKTNNLRNTDLIEIKVRHENKDDARDVAEAVAEAYRAYRTELEKKNLEKGLQELRKAVQERGDRVQEARRKLTKLSRDEGIIYRDPESRGNNILLEEDQEAAYALTQYNKLTDEAIEIGIQVKNLSKYDSEQLLIYAAGLDLPDNIIKTLYPEYLEFKREIDGLRTSGLGQKHPTIVSQNRILFEMKEDLNEGVVNLRDRLKGQLEIKKERLAKSKLRKDETKQRALERSIDNQEYNDAQTDYEKDRELLEQMKLKLISTEVSEEMTADTIVVHEEPVIAKSPVSPNVPLNMILGVVVGIVFGVGIAFFLEYLDTSVKTLEDVEKYLQVPVLAVIPQDVGVLHNHTVASPDAEAYRILRTNIEFNRKNPEDNAMTIVSGAAGEGKSTTLVNLAYICAQGGYTTLMIDADLRRPRLHTFFDVDNAMGLSNYLVTNTKLEEVILQTPVENLFFMPSGKLPTDAAGILNSRRMSEMVQDVKRRFDLVLIDSPPILGVSDASVLASEVDLTIIVIQHRKLPRNMLLRVKQAIENVGGHVIGVVLNNVDVRSDSQYQYYTSYYSYYSAANEALAESPDFERVEGDSSKASKASNDNNSGDLY